MQHDDQSPPAYRRPSLLSTEQQQEAARASADARQSTQAADKSPLDAGKAKRGKAAWLAGGAVLVAVCAGAAVWLALEADTMPAVVASGPAAPVLADPVTPAPLAKPGEADVAAATTKPAGADVAAATTKPAEADVSAAAILEQGAPAPAAAANDPSLKDMLNAPSAPKPKSPGEELSKLLASSPAAPKKAAAKAADTPAKAAQLAKAGDKKPAPPLKAAPKAAAKPTDDASLLAALEAHSKQQQGEQRPAANAAAPTSLKQCKQLNAAQAEQCLLRLCAGSAKDDPQCKSRRVPNPAAD
ncbi:hypothetical protein PO883_12880 [Massilia sp. DJPM01]|uniref:hypothetical protein n=1 Tax=Massilia sp. DJPM01 TaxID=3024404 RepID=UPI00259E6AFD|nr:hypothetical protein [Massilia sp. DJPM01]MDM5178085.1 hypothetical protein [Massilia sp. DJPM01]